MTTIKNNSKIFQPLDAYEADLELAMSNITNMSDLQSVANEHSQITRYANIAKNSIAKRKNVNLRLSTRDLFKLKSRALQEGMPYQTLMSSVLHRFVSGRLVSV